MQSEHGGVEEAIGRLRELKRTKVEARARYEQTIAAANEAIAQINNVLQGIDESINALQTPTARQPDKDAPALLGKYTGRGITEAVLDVVRQYGAAPGLFVTEIIPKLQAEGFRADGTQLYSNVYTTAMRLLKKGSVTRGEKQGKRTFVRK